jgi:hypothetical protein
MQYFDHSTDASTDPKVMQLRLEHDGAAVDAYWYLVEQMHRDERPLCVGNANVMRVHCHTLCTDVSTLESWINSMVEIGLFHRDVDSDFIVSERVMGNVEKYQTRQEKARSAAESRWSNADAMQTHKRTHSKRNANPMPTKQNKTKQNKINNGEDSAVAAAAVKTAPPAEKKGFCPMCDVPVWKDSLGVFHCNHCQDTFAKTKVVWR